MVNIFWFRRDLRFDDNLGLFKALSAGLPVLPLFIFDDDILGKLENKSDARVGFIHKQLNDMNTQLQALGRGILIEKGKPLDVFSRLASNLTIKKVYSNADFEPYGIERDDKVKQFLKNQNIEFEQFTDHVIFSPDEILKSDGKPYTIYTPYSKRWRAKLEENLPQSYPSEQLLMHFIEGKTKVPELEEIGIAASKTQVRAIKLDEKVLLSYASLRDLPAEAATTWAGVYLRFGTISIRKLVLYARQLSSVYLGELIWREFFMQILYHFPHTVGKNFYRKYDGVVWRNDPADFEAWCNGMTGYPMVDAGMRELNVSGLMHNRVRMVVASFLTKHLLIDWRWGEAYFASKLLDFELSSNVGNWQWAAGTGCDAAPYFRVFNPTEQARKFDPHGKYIQRWVPEVNEFSYPRPIVDHAFARNRAISTYKKGIEAFGS